MHLYHSERAYCLWLFTVIDKRRWWTYVRTSMSLCMTWWLTCRLWNLQFILLMMHMRLMLPTFEIWDQKNLYHTPKWVNGGHFISFVWFILCFFSVLFLVLFWLTWACRLRGLPSDIAYKMESRSVYSIFMVGNLQVKRSLGTHIYRWKFVIKMNLCRKRHEDVKWIKV
jgi:hypothetical protein